MAERAKPDAVETAPDPDEDDLDDLDDVLDQFQAKPSHASASAAAPSSTSPSSHPTAAPAADSPSSRAKDAAAAEPGEDSEDFAKQLQAGMQNLMGELGENPDMQRQFEEMMQELIRAGAAPDDKKAGEHLRHAADEAGKVGTDAGETGGTGPGATSGVRSGSKEGTGRKAGGGAGSGGGGGDFNDTIRRTMERMQASGDAATAASTSGAAGGGSEEDLLAQMMKELQSGGGGAGGEEDFNKMLMSMMSQLTNKEILYEPMKELDDKFPEWLRRHEDAADVEKGEMERYKEQRRLVREIVARFERKEYRDENEEDREYIVDRMQKMQAQGSPPPDLVGDMSAAQEALGDLDQGCPQQ
ncbi:hypothetical protein KC340_g14800 [Hortaea werneckii]|nr:hypothetical protein KC342_g15144 [Hortaea werneckii]KAI7098896.1 hypothetical protein KC339_g8609 [Hortaea werneckii]KAI7215531.1 hypothetical protein KC365_g13545 [Hortaea werneckii]KAI7297673.1 hypothetical protein KC340_g14800 [Hortaea werneckii]KAI7384866.1 hypothetical protein KC328_g10597 [Hortaea werneckii]